MKRFQRPTLDEVTDYCRERNSTVDPGEFIDFYDSKGWKVGSTPMKDWQAAIRNWERRANKSQANQTEMHSGIKAWLAEESDVDETTLTGGIDPGSILDVQS